MSERAGRSAGRPSFWVWRWLSAAVVLIAAVAVGEWLGWPFLAGPIERVLSDKLNRKLSFSQAGVDVRDEINSPSATTNNAKAFRIRFIGGLRLIAPQLEIAAPAWSSAPHLLLARDVQLDLRYIDLWRAYRGHSTRIERLQATTLDAELERLSDGRASWQFSSQPSVVDQSIPTFGHLQVGNGTLRYRDAVLAADVVAHLSLVNGGQADSVLQVDATGEYRKLPLKLDLVSTGMLPSSPASTSINRTSTARTPIPVPVTLNATLGRASIAFKGSAADAFHLDGLSGRFSLKGPSLAAVGDAVNVTLPTTAAFRTDGVIVKLGKTWHVVIDDATVGASSLSGAFTYEAGRSVPLLSGRLNGTRLLLVDLGPVVGTSSELVKSTAPSNAAPKNTITASAADKSNDMVLPNRRFDLAALRAMDANVLIDINEVDLNTRFLEPLHPLRVHLQLTGGVLTLNNLDATTAQGQLMGNLSLDGRQSIALWDATLRWSGVRLERWIHQTRAEGLPPYISGQMQGRATLHGEGRSTAEILGSLKGQIHSELREGAISHLIVEGAGLDIAQGLGILVKGDDALPVQCGVTELIAEGGVLRPRVMVIDTTDSSIWIDGSLSLATEALDLRAVVMPKDFSPMTLRAPLRVRGSFAHPDVTLDKGTMGLKLGSAFLLALVNPLAALIPLIDPGDADAAKRGAAGCMGLTQRAAAKKSRINAIAQPASISGVR